MCCTSPHQPTRLSENIAQAFDSVQGRFALAFYNPASGETISINADQEYHAASTMKTPVMIELFRQAERGEIDLDDTLVITNRFKSIVDSSEYQLSEEDDSELFLYDRLGETATIRELNYLMIIRSSNLATNMLVELADAGKVTTMLRENGISNTPVLRGVEDIKAYEQGLSNRTTANDQVQLYRMLAEQRLAGDSETAEMISILKDQHFSEIIPKHLPEGTQVAHKTGSITGVQHDCGIVYLEDGRWYVLALLSSDMPDTDAGVRMMAKVSRAIYDHVNQPGL